MNNNDFLTTIGNNNENVTPTIFLLTDSISNSSDFQNQHDIWSTEGDSVIRIIAMVSAIMAIVFGLPFNVITFFIMKIQGKDMHSASTCWYLMVVAVFDALYILSGPIWRFVVTLPGGVDLSYYYFCLDYYIFYLSPQLSAWSLVAVQIDRVIRVWLPMKATELCTRRRAVLVVLGLTLSLGILNIVHLIHWKPTETSDSKTCYYRNKESEYFQAEIYPIIDLMLYAIIPSAMMIVCNLLIIIRMNYIIKMMEMSASAKGFRVMTITLLVTSAAFIIFTLPYKIVHYLRQINYEIPHEKIVYIVLKHFQHMNHSCNFILYVLLCKPFQKIFLKCITCKTQIE